MARPWDVFAAICLLAFLCAGCGGQAGSVLQEANEAKALSLLHRYRVAQFIFLQENEGRFGSLAELQRSGHLGAELAGGGVYQFGEIEPGARAQRAGLGAYPSGKSGRYVFLMLLDSEAKAEDNLWNVYRAGADRAERLTQWPDESRLASAYEKMPKYKPR